MLLILLLLFTVLPMAELWLLLQMGASLGWPATLLVALGTGVVGASLARSQGLATLARLSEQMRRGEPPADALVDGAMILLAGAVLVTPGVLTDAAGFALLIPPIRAALKPLLRAAFRRAVRRGVVRGEVFVATPDRRPDRQTGAGSDRVIDAEVIDVKSRDAGS